MRPLSSGFLMFLCLVSGAMTTSLVQGQGNPTTSDPKKFEDFDTVTKGARESEGLFRLHWKEDRLMAEIRADQFEKPMLLPVAVAKGAGMGGHTLNFDEQWVVFFRRVGDKVHLVRRNVRFQAKAGSPAARAVATTYTDSVLTALKIISIHSGRQSVLISLNDIFMNDLAQLGMGSFDASRSTWAKVKVFPRNLELDLLATYSGRGTDDSVIDTRGKHAPATEFLAAGARRAARPEKPVQALRPEKEDRLLDRALGARGVSRQRARRHSRMEQGL